MGVLLEAPKTHLGHMKKTKRLRKMRSHAMKSLSKYPKQNLLTRCKLDRTLSLIRVYSLQIGFKNVFMDQPLQIQLCRQLYLSSGNSIPSSLEIMSLLPFKRASTTPYLRRYLPFQSQLWIRRRLKQSSCKRDNHDNKVRFDIRWGFLPYPSIIK